MDVEREELFSALKSFLVTYFMPEKCYDLFFQRLDFSHGPCVKLLMKKLVGPWMAAALLAPVFQLWRMVQAGSSEGLSLVSALLDLLAVSAHVVFCVQLSFPMSAWVGSLFLLVQLALVVFLIQHYRGNSITGGVYLFAYGAFMYLLTSPLTPRSVVSATHEWSVLIVITSRLIQVGCNHSRGSTGQLSGMCVFLLFMGSLGRVFGSIQDSGHSLQSQACVLSSCCSALLLLQVLLFRNRQPVDGERERQIEGRENKKEQ